MFYIIFLSFFLLSFQIISRLDKNMKFIERAAMTYLLGTAEVSLLGSFFIYTKGRINLLEFMIPAIISFVISLLIIFKKGNTNLKLLKRVKKVIYGQLKRINITSFEGICLLIIGLLLATTIINGLYWPVSSWDSLTLYDFRGKIIAQGFSLSDLFKQTFKDWDFYSYYFSYPLFTSILHSVSYMTSGPSPQIFYSLYYVSLVVIFYSTLLRFSDRKTTAFLTLMLALSPVIFSDTTIAYPNLPYATYFVTGFFIFYRYTKEGRPIGLLMLSLLMNVFAYAVRPTEPFLVAFALIYIIDMLVSRNIKTKIIYLFLFFILLYILNKSWSLYFQREAFAAISYPINLDKRSSLFDAGLAWGSLRTFSNLPEIIKFIYNNSKGAVSPILVLMSATSVFFYRNKIKDNIYSIIFVVACYLLIVAGTLYISYIYDFWKIIGESLSRIVIFIIPLLLFTIGCFWRLPSTSILKWEE